MTMLWKTQQAARQASDLRKSRCTSLQESPFPLFDEVKAEDVVPGITQLLDDLNAQLDDLEKKVEPTWSGLVEPLERLTDRLSLAWGTVSHLKVSI